MRLRGVVAVLLILLSISGVYAFDLDRYDRYSEPKISETETPNMAGVAVLVHESPYRGESIRVTAVPIIFWEKDRLFVRATYAGVIVAQTDELELNLHLAPRLMGYDASETGYLNGMQDRGWSKGWSLDAGTELIWEIPKLDGASLSVSFASDILDESDGQEARISFSKLFDFEPFYFKPAVSVEWQSEEMVDYYYGVRSSEATAARPAYFPDDAINCSVKFDFYMGLSKDWLLVSRLNFNFLNDEISDSPIVDEEYTVTGLLGITRMF
ncbi:MAG: MipA/OmpV family protein [Candidatus Omnitrophota bacterium]|nr:MAG: MipA/OmpV family protein [Candidatus Omnitrophota bacterium]